MFAGNASMFASKLNTDGWAPFTVTDTIIKSGLRTLCSTTILLMGCTIHSKIFQGGNFCGCYVTQPHIFAMISLWPLKVWP